MVFDMLKKIIKYGIDVVYRYTSNRVINTGSSKQRNAGHPQWPRLLINFLKDPSGFKHTL